LELEAAPSVRPGQLAPRPPLPRFHVSGRVVLSVGALLAISFVILLLPIDYAAMGAYGYLGVFVVTLLATGLIFLPVPYLAVIVGAGSYLDPWTLALVAGVAAALGELSGYAIGATGRAILPDQRWCQLLHQGMRRVGAPIVFLGALIPNPLFDAIGVVAGITRLPLWQFLLVCFVGKAARFFVFASAGAAYL
jgi:membrane protein YqaA with SNARE-associated domain